VICNGVFLDSPVDLINWWRKEVGQLPDGADIKCHHMTSYYKPKGDQKDLPYGRSVFMKVVGFAHSAEIAAVVVECDIPSKNRFKHVTVWTNGVSPAASNKLLADGFTHVDGPVLSGTVDFFDGR
jgi:hypothetical protein